MLELVVQQCRRGASVQTVGENLAGGRNESLGLDWTGWEGDFEWLRQALLLLLVVKFALAEQGQARSSDTG
jgi:hypothetical protein